MEAVLLFHSHYLKACS